ncbi:MAG: hypothetical protein WCS01_05805 [bacterium]
MKGQLKHLPKPVVRAILSYYHRKRVFELLRALSVPVLCYAILALVATHLDRFLFLEMPARLWISGLTHGLTLLAGGISLGVFAWRRVSVSRLAYEMERRLPKETAERLVTLDDVLVRAVGGSAADTTVRAALVEQLTAETVALCERTPHTARLARDRHLRRQVWALLILALGWAGLFMMPAYQFPLMLQRLMAPGRNLPKPSFMRLTVTPEAPVVGRGGEVVLKVWVDGEIPRWIQRPMRWLGADADLCLLASATGKVDRLSITRDARPMSRVQRRLFVASRNDLQESFSYRVRCGDAQTDIRLVRVVVQPRATGVSVEVEPPAYTRLKTVVVEDLRDPIPAFATSRVQVRFTADQSPLKSARLVRQGDGSMLADLKPDPKTGAYRYEFVMADPIEMEIVLVNELGFENTERVRLSMALREDQAPGVRLDYPAGDLTVAQGELVSTHMELTDDLGLLEGALCYQINPDLNPDAPSREILLPVEENRLMQELSANFDLAKVGVVPGDEVLLWARARDTGRTDERSPSVRIHVTAFAGNENERRRLSALNLVAQTLVAVEPSTSEPTVLALNAGAYESVTLAATAQGFVLGSQPTPENLLDFIEREHHFTDGAEAAAEVRLLYGVIFAQLYLPLAASPHSGEARRAALKKLATATLPALLRERMACDLVRRALNLRGETRAIVGAGGASDRNQRASYERRVDLLLEALDSTGADLAVMARGAPLIRIDDVLSFSRQINRSGRDLKHADPERQQSACKTLCEAIDGWIGLLLDTLPEWKTQRRAAREALRAEYDRLRGELNASWLAPGLRSATASRWIAADARMVERSPFLGLSERLALASPTNAAMLCEAALLSRMAVDSEFGERMAAARVRPAERRLDAALKALDLADSGADRTATAGRLRALNLDDEAATVQDIVAPTVPFGLYAALPVLAKVATASLEPYDKAMESLAARTESLLDRLSNLEPTPGKVNPGAAAALAALESGLAQWEVDALRLSYRLHLDLTYGDPRREQTVRLATTLPGLRDVLSRYQVLAVPLLSRLRSRLQRTSGTDNVSAMTLEMEELTRCVKGLGSGLTRMAKQMRGETPSGEESSAVREMRLYYTDALKLAEAADPAEVAGAFFTQHPSAGAIVLEERMPMLRDLRNRLKEAGEVLRTETASSAAFLGAMKQAASLAADFQAQVARFAALDANGAVRALAADTRQRADALIRPGREVGAATLPRDRLAVDELQRQAEQFENQARDLILRNGPVSPTGWWGGPAGVWDGAGRRDAEHARRRVVAQYNRARRDAALGFDAVVTRRGKPGSPLPDEPLAGALLAWRTLHSSLGGGTLARPPPKGGDAPRDQLVRWLMSELDETSKALRRTDAAARPFQAPTSRWVESAKGYLRH